MRDVRPSSSGNAVRCAKRGDFLATERCPNIISSPPSSSFALHRHFRHRVCAILCSACWQHPLGGSGGGWWWWHTFAHKRCVSCGREGGGGGRHVCVITIATQPCDETCSRQIVIAPLLRQQHRVSSRSDLVSSRVSSGIIALLRMGGGHVPRVLSIVALWRVSFCDRMLRILRILWTSSHRQQPPASVPPAPHRNRISPE